MSKKFNYNNNKQTNEGFDEAYIHIRRVYGTVQLQSFRFNFNGYDRWAMKILRAKYHSVNCDFKTCGSKGPHYHYICKFNLGYIQWCDKNKKHLLHGFKAQYGGDLLNINHKKLKMFSIIIIA
jgi:hypothetical protein